MPSPGALDAEGAAAGLSPQYPEIIVMPLAVVATPEDMLPSWHFMQAAGAIGGAAPLCTAPTGSCGSCTGGGAGAVDEMVPCCVPPEQKPIIMADAFGTGATAAGGGTGAVPAWVPPEQKPIMAGAFGTGATAAGGGIGGAGVAGIVGIAGDVPNASDGACGSTPGTRGGG
tara:strand:- start:28 stop:540 length:513 start_codon:yes stop_codon:yes gene_type:complete